MIREPRRDNGERKNLSNKCCWENWAAMWKRMKLHCCLKTYTLISSKRIKDLNVKPETIKYIEDNTGTKLLDIGHSDVFGI